MSLTLAHHSLELGFEAARPQGLLNSLRVFRAKTLIRYESEDFIVRTAENGADLTQVLQLRHEIFIKEWQGRSTETGLDVEPFDFVGDHLMIIDKRESKVVGTYRLLNSQGCESFYSQNEFVMDRFLMWPSLKLELGRAGVHKDYRNGNTIDLLWKGLSRYIEASGARYLFGCASVKTTDAGLISSLVAHLNERGQLNDEYQIRPTKDYEFSGFDFESAQPLTPKQSREWIPPLLRSYLHAGAQVHGHPALDREFECVDLLTVLDMTKLNTKFRQRFFGV